MMSKSPHPTPYTDVNAVLDDFETRIRAILGGHFVGMYLYGSLVLGDFDPQASDIDFIVVTEDEIDDDLFAVLHDIHTHFAESGSPWADRLEAAYIPRDALRQNAPTAAQYPQIERGLTLVKAPLENGWAFQRHSLREYGITVTGPDPREMIEPVDRRDMQQAALVIVGGWLEQARSDQEWLAWARVAGPQAFVVLTLCRILYSLETGDVASMPAAARWAQGVLGPRWAVLIERSLDGLHHEEETPESSLADTIELIQVTLERCQRQPS